VTEQTLTKPAAQTAGDYITHNNGAVFRVEHVQPYRDGVGREQVGLTVTPIGTGEPTIWLRFAVSPMTLATDEQVLAAIEERDRADLVQALHQLAKLIGQHKIRVESFAGLSVTASLPAGEITRVAELLGVGVTSWGSTGRACATVGTGVASRIALELLGEPAPEVAAAPEVVPAEQAGERP
jgi:hypothetical protein